MAEQTLTIDLSATGETDERKYAIKEASIKDDFCNYTFEITDGVGLGDTHNVKGSGIILDDLRQAFGRLNVHLACIDDVFKHSNVEIQDIDGMHAHDLSTLYNVSGIKMKGTENTPSVILVGNKYVSTAGGRIEIVTPKIPLDSLSSYKWYNELAAEVEKVRSEVELYKEGKYQKVETEEETGGSFQLKITDVIDSKKGRKPKNTNTDTDSEFDSARV